MNKALFKYSMLIGLLSLLVNCETNTNQRFKIEPRSNTGLDFNNVLKDTTDQNILDYLYFYNGGGVAIGDIDNDGLSDVFFVSNQNENKLYLNKGDLKFEDISQSSGIKGGSTWNTGVSMADVNGDGYLDIYVCAVVGTNGFIGHNELFINNGDRTFTEQSQAYGLDFTNYSSKASFFDYDLDGDLDMYLLNHAIHTQESYGKSEIRTRRNDLSGDKLLRNDGDRFTDVSEAAGIYGGPNGYGLDISVSDFNNDGFPDLYISNDFHEDDYYYINNGDGTFRENLKVAFGHISKFSMGSDAADINNDGYTDIISLDMLPEDEMVLKSSAGDDDIQLQQLRTETFGYHYQYSRNMLQINGSDHNFSETALLSGIAATDWSWSALIADYDNDGHQDIFISNGIPKRPNDLDYINYISDSQISKKLSTTNFIDKEALDLMPEGKLKNYYFEGDEGIRFNSITDFADHPASFSTGAAYGDLDNDGDLDLVVNNINQNAFLYNNQSTETNFCTLTFQYTGKNPFGIGTKVKIYIAERELTRELYPQRGFQSSSEPRLHFGLGTNNTIDSLKVIWPNKTEQVLRSPSANSMLTISYDGDKARPISKPFEGAEAMVVFKRQDTLLKTPIVHEENDYTDFNRHKLLHYKLSDRGPALAIADLNNDGLEDMYFGSSKNQKDQLMLQTPEGFNLVEDSVLHAMAIKESVSAQIADFNKDGKNDLIIGHGGGEYFGTSKALVNTVLTFNETIEPIELPDNFEDTAVIKTADFDRDGDTDIFVGNATLSNNFGFIPESYVLVNTNGRFSKQTLGQLGMVRDAIWTDFNNDEKLDLIVVGEWMAPSFLVQDDGGFKNVSSDFGINALNGLWRCIAAFDIDNDGDEDYVLGNWGENSKFKASPKTPMRMYYADFDTNFKAETIIAIEKDNQYYPLDGLDRLSKQLSTFFKKKYNTYKNFAGQTIEEVLGEDLIASSKLFEVHTLQSGYLLNDKGTFSFQPFDEALQVAPINSMLTVNHKKGKGLVLAGNYKGVIPYHGKLDGFKGALILDRDHILTGDAIGLDFYDKVINQLGIININNKEYLVAVVHNGAVQFYEIK